jgi:hypothetical protein
VILVKLSLTGVNLGQTSVERVVVVVGERNCEGDVSSGSGAAA